MTEGKQQVILYLTKWLNEKEKLNKILDDETAPTVEGIKDGDKTKEDVVNKLSAITIPKKSFISLELSFLVFDTIILVQLFPIETWIYSVEILFIEFILHDSKTFTETLEVNNFSFS